MPQIEFTNIIVDDFSIARREPNHTYTHILTHIHTDHLKGLSDGWDCGPIYCSRITKQLLLQRYPSLNNLVLFSLQSIPSNWTLRKFCKWLKTCLWLWLSSMPITATALWWPSSKATWAESSTLETSALTGRSFSSMTISTLENCGMKSLLTALSRLTSSIWTILSSRRASPSPARTSRCKSQGISSQTTSRIDPLQDSTLPLTNMGRKKSLKRSQESSERQSLLVSSSMKYLKRWRETCVCSPRIRVKASLKSYKKAKWKVFFRPTSIRCAWSLVAGLTNHATNTSIASS